MAEILVRKRGPLRDGGASGQVRLRETDWGFIIHSPDPGGQARPVLLRAARFATRAVWLAVAGLWLLPLTLDPQIGILLKALATAALLALTYGGVAMIRRSRCQEVHVDTRQRELRRATMTPQGESRIDACFAFDEVGAAVLERGTARGDPCTLCLRLNGRAEVIPVAAGEEPVLLGVHDRLMRDLRPVEERMSARGLPAHPARSARARQAFPMLGPSETGQRARRATLR